MAQITDTVAFGLQLATTIQAYVEGLRKKYNDHHHRDSHLTESIADIHATASALKQLQDIVHADRCHVLGDGPLVFTEEGRKEVENLGILCRDLYISIIICLTKASGFGWKEKLGKKESGEDGGYGEIKNLRMGDLGKSLNWYWLAPRVKKIQEQLGWLKMELLMMGQIGGLAQFQLRTPERSPGRFEEELALRSIAAQLWIRHLKCVKKLIKKHNKPTSSSSASEVSLIESVMEIINLDVSERKIPEEQQDVKTPETKVVMVDNLPCQSKAPSISSSNNTLIDTPVFIDVLPKEMELPRPMEGQSPPIGPPPPPAAARSKASLTAPVTMTHAEDNKVDIMPLTDYESKFGKLSSWIKHLFGNGVKSTRDVTSQEIEAYIVHSAGKAMKLPFGHQRLSYGLKRTLKDNKGSTWDQYMAMDYGHRLSLDSTISGAKKADSRERTMIALDYGKTKAINQACEMVVFLSIGTPVEPIRFKDAVGRKFVVPFESCRTWKGMEDVIKQAFLHVDVVGPQVMQGHFDLTFADRGTLNPGTIILPALWDSMIIPGTDITMHMWPVPNPLRPRLSGGPPMPPAPRPFPYSGPPRPPGMCGVPGPPSLPRGSITPPPPGVWRPYHPQANHRGPQPPWNRKKPVYISDFSDSDILVSDSEIEDGPEDLGIKIDYTKEEEKMNMGFGKMLKLMTNATYGDSGNFCEELFESESDSSSGSGSSSSFADD